MYVLISKNTIGMCNFQPIERKNEIIKASQSKRRQKRKIKEIKFVLAKFTLKNNENTLSFSKLLLQKHELENEVLIFH